MFGFWFTKPVGMRLVPLPLPPARVISAAASGTECAAESVSQRSPLAVIESSEGMGHEATEHRSGVAVAPSRGRDAEVVSTTDPGEASIQVVSAGDPAPGDLRLSSLVGLCRDDAGPADAVLLRSTRSRAGIFGAIAIPPHLVHVDS